MERGEIFTHTLAEILWRGFKPNGVVFGLAPIPTDPPSDKVLIAQGWAFISGVVLFKFPEEVQISPPEPSKYTKALVYLKKDGSYEVAYSSSDTAFPPGATGKFTVKPEVPSLPSDSAAICEIFLPPNTTQITEDLITDRRLFVLVPLRRRVEDLNVPVGTNDEFPAPVWIGAHTGIFADADIKITVEGTFSEGEVFRVKVLAKRPDDVISEKIKIYRDVGAEWLNLDDKFELFLDEGVVSVFGFTACTNKSETSVSCKIRFLGVE